MGVSFYALGSSQPMHLFLTETGGEERAGRVLRMPAKPRSPPPAERGFLLRRPKLIRSGQSTTASAKRSLKLAILSSHSLEMAD
jgi:hypothetical protein